MGAEKGVNQGTLEPSKRTRQDCARHALTQCPRLNESMTRLPGIRFGASGWIGPFIVYVGSGALRFRRLEQNAESMDHNRPIGITIVACLMIFFGIAEIATGLRHSFLGLISTSTGALAAYGAAAVGSLYAIAGLLLLTMRKWAARLALGCLVLVILGRIALVLTGLYPLNSFIQTFSIIIGTTIAAAFAAYIWTTRKSFR